jgi:hypothetical protein
LMRATTRMALVLMGTMTYLGLAVLGSSGA